MTDDAGSIWDEQAQKSRLLSRQCDTCIFRPGNKMHLRPGRLKDMVQGAQEPTADGFDGSYVVCHETLPYAPWDVLPAVCRGFYVRYSTQTLQIIERLWGWVEVDPPSENPT